MRRTGRVRSEAGAAAVVVAENPTWVLVLVAQPLFFGLGWALGEV
jgi:hypothetical protein